MCVCKREREIEKECVCGACVCKRESEYDTVCV